MTKIFTMLNRKCDFDIKGYITGTVMVGDTKGMGGGIGRGIWWSEVKFRNFLYICDSQTQDMFPPQTDHNFCKLLHGTLFFSIP